MSEDIDIINQSTRIEKIKNFFINNSKKLIGVILIILFGLFSYLVTKNIKKGQN